MIANHFAVSAALGCLLALPAVGRAQQPMQLQMDSLAAEIRTLKARLDSLGALLARARGPAPAAVGDTAAGDELAALRAAAAAAAGRSDTLRPDSAAQAPTRFVGRERNLSQLNPEITVTGDVRAYARWPRSPGDNFDPREFEFGFQSALDPYASTRIFVSIEGDQVAIEEGYAYWTGLPGRLRLDVGKYRQQFGELNRWHLHAVPETEYPLALSTYLGEDGLSGTGLSLYRAFGGLGTHELTGQMTLSSSDAELFADGRRPSYLVRVLNFWPLTGSTFIQLGATGLYGTNPDSSLKTMVGGIDFRITWRPPARALYREWTLRGELFALRKEHAAAGNTRLGGYVGSTYKLGRRWIAGARWDYVEDPTSGLITRQVTPSLTLWQSEWMYIRGEYRWQKLAGADATSRLALQAVWAMGPHKHETY